MSVQKKNINEEWHKKLKKKCFSLANVTMGQRLKMEIMGEEMCESQII